MSWLLVSDFPCSLLDRSNLVTYDRVSVDVVGRKRERRCCVGLAPIATEARKAEGKAVDKRHPHPVATKKVVR